MICTDEGAIATLYSLCCISEYRLGCAGSLCLQDSKNTSQSEVLTSVNTVLEECLSSAAHDVRPLQSIKITYSLCWTCLGNETKCQREDMNWQRLRFEIVDSQKIGRCSTECLAAENSC